MPGQLDAAALKALAHPLRLKLLGRLRAEGPATATELAARIGGVTSGTTSWHLRQLADAGLVADAPSASGRERRWEAAHPSTEVGYRDPAEDPEAAAAADVLLHLFAAAHGQALATWLDARTGYDPAWRDASEVSDYLLRLRPDQMQQLARDIEHLVHRYRADQPEGPEVRPVTVILHAFPRVDLDPSAGPPS